MTREEALTALTARAIRGEVVVLVGDDLAELMTGQPSRSRLAERLANDEHVAQPAAANSLVDVAGQVFPPRRARDRLAAYLAPPAAAGANPPLSTDSDRQFWRAIAALPVPYWLTTAHHAALARTLAAGGRSANELVTDADLLQRRLNVADIAYLSGHLDRPGTLVVSAADHDALLAAGGPRAALLRRTNDWLSTKLAFVVGCDPSDGSDFSRHLWQRVLRHRGAFQGGAILVWPEPAAADVATWAGRGVTVLDGEPLATVDALADRLAGRFVTLPPDPDLVALAGALALVRSPNAESDDRDTVLTDLAAVHARTVLWLHIQLRERDGKVQARVRVRCEPDVYEVGEDDYRPTGMTLDALEAWAAAAATLRRQQLPLEGTAVEATGIDLLANQILPAASEAREWFEQALWHAQTADGAELRVVLDLAAAGRRLAPYPWEILHAGTLSWNGQVTGRGFLGLKYPVFRRAASVTSPGQMAGRPRRALVIGADPYGNLVDMPAEVEWLADTLRAQGGLAVDVLSPDDARLDDVEAVKTLVRDGDYHWLHFVGHGEFDADDAKESALILGTLAVPKVRLTAERLAELGRSCALTFVFLSACDLGAAAPPGRPWEESGAANALYENGVPAVLAMRWRVGDDTCRRMATVFYRDLLRGASAEVALMHARQAVHDRPDWANPVLLKRLGVLGDAGLRSSG